MASKSVALPLRAVAQRAFSYRRSGVGMQVAGRAGHTGSSRIRPAVGDQAGGITEAKTRVTSPERDDDWIKVSEYVSSLNPSIVNEATSAVKREKWRGEGVQQAAFERPSVSAVSAISIACTSDMMGARIHALLSALLGGASGSAANKYQCGGTSITVQPMGAEWFRKLRSMSDKPDCARFEDLEFLSEADNIEALQQACAERELALVREGNGTCFLHPALGRSRGFMQQVGLALRHKVEAIPAKYSVRLADPALCSDASPAEAPLQVSVKEVVIGSDWNEHGAYERFFDRLAGSASRVALGLWQLPGGPAIRLIPTDESGVKSLVLHVPDATHAAQVLERAGFSSQSFPGYLAVSVCPL